MVRQDGLEGLAHPRRGQRQQPGVVGDGQVGDLLGHVALLFVWR